MTRQKVVKLLIEKKGLILTILINEKILCVFPIKKVLASELHNVALEERFCISVSQMKGRRRQEGGLETIFAAENLLSRSKISIILDRNSKHG